MNKCKRCGTCCKKGGPCLHLADAGLITQGIIGPADLVTYREGEPVLDPAKEEVFPLSNDMIKIKSAGDVRRCRFFDQACGCMIYVDRPLECRLLKCWDTREIEKVFLRDTLARRDLLPEGSKLREIVDSYDRIFRIADVLGAIAPGDDLSDGIKAMVEADRLFRERAVSLIGIGPDTLDFFFGRAIREIVQTVTGISREEGR